MVPGQVLPRRATRITPCTVWHLPVRGQQSVQRLDLRSLDTVPVSAPGSTRSASVIHLCRQVSITAQRHQIAHSLGRPKLRVFGLAVHLQRFEEGLDMASASHACRAFPRPACGQGSERRTE